MCGSGALWGQQMSHLGIELQISLASSTGINGELSRLVHDAACRLQAGSKGFHLCGARVEGGVGDEEDQCTGAQSSPSVGARTPPCPGSSLVGLVGYGQ